MEEKEKEVIIELRNVWYRYPAGREKQQGKEILKGASYSFLEGKIYAVMGKSGAGKTTLLSLMGALMQPVQGEILYRGRTLKEIGIREFRSRHAGFVFQNYNLLEYLTVQENVRLASQIAGASTGASAEELLARVDIPGELLDRKVGQISGGERQRVAIARAVGKGADLILADEPTGNLDEESADRVMEVFKKISHEEGCCVILVTHSTQIAGKADQILRLEEGNLRLCPFLY